jgi:transcriptional regulator with XRE-family HTH domain
MFHENFPIAETEQDHRMDKKLKITEIARRTNLSTSTVSRVLAGRPIPAKRPDAWYWNVRVS